MHSISISLIMIPLAMLAASEFPKGYAASPATDVDSAADTAAVVGNVAAAAVAAWKTSVVAVAAGYIVSRTDYSSFLA